MPKDKLVNTSLHGDGESRVKSIKNIGNGVKTQLIKNPDGSTITQRYEDNKLVASDYNPKKMKVKKMRKKRVAKPKPLKAGPTPSYTAPAVTAEEQVEMDKQERINKYNKKNRKKKGFKNIVNKIKSIIPKKGRRTRKTRNLVTGGINRTQ
tara:strand:- start:4520 stop:4972 length:453 start_codon:yes stop_codon:yes gene_type:complete